MTLEVMWSRMLVLALLVALLVGGAPSVGAARELAPRGQADVPQADVPQAVRGSWSWPLPAPHSLARAYFAPPTTYAAGHRGIDIRGTEGADVIAPDDGVVHYSGFVVDRPVLSISQSDGVLSSFEPIRSALVAGETVARGQVIGQLDGGHCETPCLHLGARVDGAYVNPLLYLGGVPWSVLLPSS